MKFIKALCVVLLVYSACSGERRTLENNPKLKVIDKVEKKLAKRMAQKLEQLVRQADKGGFWRIFNLIRVDRDFRI